MLELVAKAAANLKVAHGQLREIERAVAALPQAEQPQLSFRCDHCIGGQGFKSQARLEEHLANVHALGLDEHDDGRSAIPTPTDDFLLSHARAARRSLDEILPPRDDERSANEEPDAA